jgi:AcrR family transcriptional regulator
MPKASLQKVREVPASTKARILEAAEEVFATKGFEGASTREIAGRAGVNISSLHYHWESKETLYYAVFQNIFDQLIDISRGTVVPATARGDSLRAVHEASVGRVFDFFAENPNVPRLLLRRILENEEFSEAIERDILMPSWREFANWVKEFSGKRIKEADAQLLILTIHSTLLLFTLDSLQYGQILGGSIRNAEIARKLRNHVIQVATALTSSQLKA